MDETETSDNEVRQPRKSLVFVSSVLPWILLGAGIVYHMTTRSVDKAGPATSVQVGEVSSTPEPETKALDPTIQQAEFVALPWDKKLAWGLVNEQPLADSLTEIKNSMERDSEALDKLAQLSAKYPALQFKFQGLIGEHLLFRAKLLTEQQRIQYYLAILPQTAEGYAIWRMSFENNVKEGRYATAAQLTGKYLKLVQGTGIEGKVRKELDKELGFAAFENLTGSSPAKVPSKEDLEFESTLKRRGVFGRADLENLAVGSWKERRITWQALHSYYLTREKVLALSQSFPLSNDSAETAETQKQTLQRLLDEAKTL